MPVKTQTTVTADVVATHAKAAASVASNTSADASSSSSCPPFLALGLRTPIPEGYVIRHFSATPLMSTYLLAFVVGDFDFVQRHTTTGIDVKVYTPPGMAWKGQFSLDLAVRALDYFADYFGCAYPLPKVDLIAIPDFAAGAMENWGLITYRDSRLLVDPSATSATDRLATSRTVCHELAHMWFGRFSTTFIFYLYMYLFALYVLYI